MKIVRVLLIAISFMFVIACSDFNNPMSSDKKEQDSSQDDSMYINESGTSERG